MRPSLEALKLAATLCANKQTKTEDDLVRLVFELADKIEKRIGGPISSK